MDPNKCLDELRELARDLAAKIERDDGQTNSLSAIDQDAERMVELFIALDDWLCKGGFVPSAWARSK